MRIVIDLVTTRFVVVIQRPSLIERLIGCRESERYAVGHAGIWTWDVGGARVPAHIEDAIRNAIAASDAVARELDRVFDDPYCN